MMGTRNGYNENERCIDALLAINSGHQKYRNTGTKLDNKRALTTEIHFQCSDIDAAASTGMETVQVVDTC